ncbi:hypothetical protein R1flu_000940 [Riccia fluitans]|uniref:Uncharacterized protein n=1 Tax=Riccia fluitans TaxID=41844 RepID=A0ABD1Y2A6_9MARC
MLSTIGDDNGLPMEFAWAIPFSMREWQEDFKQYDNLKLEADKLNIKKFCDNQWPIDHWEAWKIQADGRTLKRSEVKKSFLFYVGLEKEGSKLTSPLLT